MKTNRNDKPKFLVSDLSKVMPRVNGTPAGVSVLAASLLRGKELVK